MVPVPSYTDAQPESNMLPATEFRLASTKPRGQVPQIPDVRGSNRHDWAMAST